MNKNYQKLLSHVKNAGFTLIELLVVVLIIGILAAIAVPQYQKAVLKTRLSEVIANVGTVGRAVQTCYLATGTYEDCQFPALDIQMPGKLINMAGDGGNWWVLDPSKNADGSQISAGVTNYGFPYIVIASYAPSDTCICYQAQKQSLVLGPQDSCNSAGSGQYTTEQMAQLLGLPVDEGCVCC